MESTGESAEVPSTASRTKKGHNTALSTRCPSSPSIIYQSVGRSAYLASIVSDVEQRSYNPIHPAAAAAEERRQHRSACVATVECVRARWRCMKEGRRPTMKRENIFIVCRFRSPSWWRRKRRRERYFPDDGTTRPAIYVNDVIASSFLDKGVEKTSMIYN